MTSPLTRRQFLRSALPGLHLTFGQAAVPSELLVIVFLRGGWDALNVVPPLAGPDRGLYEQARPGIKITASALLPLDERFGLHPALAPLFDLYQAKHMAVVHAVGLDYDTRSHFDAQEFIELGTPGKKSTPTGWLTRALQTNGGTPGLLPVAALPSQPTSLLGTDVTVSLSSLDDLSQWDEGNLAAQQAALDSLYAGGDLLAQTGRDTLAAVRAVAALTAEK